MVPFCRTFMQNLQECTHLSLEENPESLIKLILFREVVALIVLNTSLFMF